MKFLGVELMVRLKIQKKKLNDGFFAAIVYSNLVDQVFFDSHMALSECLRPRKDKVGI